ncbi:MAG TPA: peptidase S41 [Geobacter sp.]|nr:peptidase S41 [Geobacter sp.]
MSRSRKIFAVFLVTAVAVCIALILYLRWRPLDTQPDSTYLLLLQEAYSAVLKNYVEKPDSKKLVQSMVDGMLATLDPHSAYLPPEPYHEMEVQMTGAFGGVGIELGIKDDKLTVIAPIEDTPAFRAGIQSNDHIFKIDKTFTRGMNISAAVKLMRGEKGKAVTLTILRNGSSKPLVFNLIRDIIKLKSLKSRQLAPGYGLIRISQFQEQTGPEFKQALHVLNSAAGGHMKGLVIDLRYNPGGLLESSVEVANCFIGDDINKTGIVSIKGRGENSREYNATLGEKEPRYPIVVLINGGSASASEILAGALQDHKRAIVMGKQSFGKGSVQSVFPLRGDAALKLTTALYYTPNGRSIQAKGIVPDVDVPNIVPLPVKEKEKGFKEKDLERSLASDGKPEQAQPQPQPPVSPHGGATRDTDLQKDYQLKRALELLQSLDMLKEKGF